MDNYVAMSINTTGFVQYPPTNDEMLKFAPYLVEFSANLPKYGLSHYRKPMLPSGITVPKTTFNYHGIDGKSGDDREETLHVIGMLIRSYDGIICHGGAFIRDVLHGEFKRAGMYDSIVDLLSIPIYDTMLIYSDQGSKKYPKLEELYESLTGNSKPENTSSTDTKLCMLLEVWKHGQSHKDSVTATAD